VAWRLASLSARITLVQELRRRGFYVRWHAYEFILYKRGPVGVLLLEPSKARAELICQVGEVEEVAREVGEALRTVAPAVQLHVRVAGGGVKGGST